MQRAYNHGAGGCGVYRPPPRATTLEVAGRVWRQNEERNIMLQLGYVVKAFVLAIARREAAREGLGKGRNHESRVSEERQQ